MATGFSPYFLTHGREARLPVQRHLDEPRLDDTAGPGLQRLWKARISVYEAQLWLETKRRDVLANSATLVPAGALVMIRLTPQDKADYPSKFSPTYMGPWVVVERSSKNVTYRVRDLVLAEQRQLTRDQFKVMELPSSFGAPADPNSSFLPRLPVSDDAVRVTVSAPDEVKCQAFLLTTCLFRRRKKTTSNQSLHPLRKTPLLSLKRAMGSAL